MAIRGEERSGGHGGASRVQGKPEWDRSGFLALRDRDRWPERAPVCKDGGSSAFGCVSAIGEGDNAVLANTDNPDEAFAFLEFLYDDMDRVWSDFGSFPASAVEVTDPKFGR